MFPSGPKTRVLSIVAGISKFFLLAKVVTAHPIIVRSLEITVRDICVHPDLIPGEDETLEQKQLPITELRPIGI